MLQSLLNPLVGGNNSLNLDLNYNLKNTQKSEVFSQEKADYLKNKTELFNKLENLSVSKKVLNEKQFNIIKNFLMIK